MSNAVVQQIGTPHEVYHDPANLFVARFIGSPGMNLLAGHHVEGVLALPGDNRYPLAAAWRNALPKGDLILGFRPEAVTVSPNGALAGRIYAADLHGAYTMLHLAIGGEDLIVHARVPRELTYAIDTPVRFDLDPAMVRLFDPQTERAMKG
jgi:multiple sugar transport system ATP-binding protein